jgi:hypothetical protein
MVLFVWLYLDSGMDRVTDTFVIPQPFVNQTDSRLAGRKQFCRM